MNEFNEKISVYGGTGFIGSNFIKLYQEDTILIPRNVLLPRSNEILYFISTTHNYNVFNDIQIDIDTNLKYLMNVLNACKSFKPTFNFISSWFVYGDCELPAKETSVCNPKGFYSITKKCAEDLLISFCKTFDIKYRIIRLANVYGAGDKNCSKQKNALQYLVNQIKDHQDIELYFGGNFIRDYIHVVDVCKAISTIIKKGNTNEIYNVGSGKPQNFLELMSLARKITNSSSNFKTIEPTEFHKIVQVKDNVLDTTKIKNLGFEPKIRIEDGIKGICGY